MWTLGELIDRDYAVWAHCHRCHRSVELDLGALAERHGRAAVVEGPKRIGTRHLSCAVCKGTTVGIALSPRNTGGTKAS